MAIKSNFLLATLGVFLALANGSVAFSQEITLTNQQKDEIAELQDVRLDSPSTTSSGGRLHTAARLLATADDSSAQLTLSTHNESAGSTSSSDFAITVTAPLSKKTKRADFLSVDGLPSQLSLGVSYTHSLVNLNVDEATFPLQQRASDLLTKATETCLVAPSTQALAAATRETKCRGLILSEAGDFLSPEENTELDALYSNTYNILTARPYTVLGLNGTIGTQKFNYFDTSTLAGQEERKVAYSAGAWVGYLPHLKSPVFFIASFETRRSYSEAGQATYCPTGATTPTVKCTTGAFGPPSGEIDHKISGKVRFKIKGLNAFGIEMSAAYDFHDDTWGVELPIYFLPNTDNSLIGGFRVAYDSKKDDFQAGIFVGKRFNLTGQ